MNKIVFTGGGTLGHVMPNLYLMEELADWEIHYIGTSGIEKDRVGGLADFHQIPAVKLKRGKFFTNLKIPFVLVKAIRQSKKYLKQIKPDVVFSKGGYVALPVCLAARSLKIPIIAHESDSSFGLANKIILKLCNNMCVNFKQLEQKNKKIIYTGPIFSKNFEKNTKNLQNLKINPNFQTILIVGGSLGSKIINDSIFKLKDELTKQFNIIHITGKGNKKFASTGNYNAFEITNDMVNLYNVADFVIGRSGAGVTAECFYKKLPMILIPLENGASRGDQVDNAKFYEEKKVATIIREADLTAETLKNEIQKMSTNLNKYKNVYSRIEHQNGKEKIIKMIKEIGNDK